jgi:mannose-6-phosphate isomerase
MQQLNEHHHDPRSAVALLMHHVRLAPGEALFLDAGCVHAYLSGLALEVQGSSDNVLRAAFTNKHVDLTEFFAIADLSPTGDARVSTETLSAITTAYRSPAPFSVMRHEVNGAFSLTTTTEHTILMCTSGSAGTLTRGSGAYLASNETVELHGTATLYSVSA